MRYALISDIHANLEALEAVLAALSKDSIDRYLCVGDIVGYGADPKGCIEIVRSLDCASLIAGNHEWGVLGLFGLEYFNDYVRDAVLWTRSVLNQGELDYLRGFELLHEEEAFTLVHGALDAPKEFNYIMNTLDAHKTMRLMKTPLCFVGHTHSAGIFYSVGGGAEPAKRGAVKLEPGRRYVVNVGSIGQPRDGDPRASYAIYDAKEQTVEIKRAAYDIEAAQEKILKAGLPPVLAGRLSEGR